MPAWSFEISDPASGATEAFTPPSSTQLTRRRCQPSQLAGMVVPTDPAIATLSVAEVAVKAYRDGVLRLYGQVSDPLTFSSAGATFTASDPLYFLAQRRLQVELDYGATDLSDIGWNLIAHEQARRTVWLRRGATDASVAVDVIYTDGSVVADLLTSLNQRDQGIWYWIDPVDGVAGILGEYRTSWPDAGVLQPGAVFEFGDGTVENLVDYSIQFGLPLNGVRATGASIGSSNVPVVRRDDATSQGLFGLIEDDFSFIDLDDTVSLDQHALDKLHPNPPVTITLTPKPYDPDAANESRVPALFDDFDAGDVVPVLIRDEQFRLYGQIRIGEATVAIADDATSEQLESLVGSGYARPTTVVDPDGTSRPGWQVTPQ
jgi:hypothetical protein